MALKLNTPHWRESVEENRCRADWRKAARRRLANKCLFAVLAPAALWATLRFVRFMLEK